MVNTTYNRLSTWKFWDFYNDWFKDNSFGSLYKITRVLIDKYLFINKIKIKLKTKNYLKKCLFNIIVNGANRNSYTTTFLQNRKNLSPSDIIKLTGIKLPKSSKYHATNNKKPISDFDYKFTKNNKEHDPSAYNKTTIDLSIDILSFWGLLDCIQIGYYNPIEMKGSSTKIWIKKELSKINNLLYKHLDQEQAFILAGLLSPNVSYTYFFKHYAFTDMFEEPKKVPIAGIRIGERTEDYCIQECNQKLHRQVRDLNYMWDNNILHFYRRFVYNDKSHGRFYNPITFLKKEVREEIMKQYGYEEVDFSAMILNTLYYYETGKFYPVRIYNVFTKTYLQKIGLKDSSEELVSYLADELKMTFVTMFNCKSPKLKLTNALKQLNENWNKNFSKIKLDSDIFMDVIKNTVPEISHYLGTQSCWDTVFIESETMRKLIMKYFKTDKLKPYFVHDAIYVPKDKVYKYTKLMQKYLGKEILSFEKRKRYEFVESMNFDWKKIVNTNFNFKNFTLTKKTIQNHSHSLVLSSHINSLYKLISKVYPYFIKFINFLYYKTNNKIFYCDIIMSLYQLYSKDNVWEGNALLYEKGLWDTA
jgi:hypothetical protein